MRLPLKLSPKGSKAFDAVGFGLNTIDLLAVVSEHPRAGTKGPIRNLEILPGGQAATAMTAVSRLGWSARYIGCFGDDANGNLGRKAMLDAGVDISQCRISAQTANALSLVIVDERSGQRTVLWSRHPGLSLGPKDVSVIAVQSGRILLVDCHETKASQKAASLARVESIPTIVDVEKVRPGIENLLDQIDVIITAKEFPEALTGFCDLGRSLRVIQERFGAAIVCTTLGADGSLALVGNIEIRTPGYKVPVIDTTGAGDAFRGGFIAGWLRGGSDVELEDILRYANATAALSCRTLGARSGVPTEIEVEALLHKI